MDAQKIIDTINEYKKHFEKYKKDFLADGKIDKKEQEQLDRLDKSIKEAEEKLKSLKKKNESQPKDSANPEPTELSWQQKVENWLNANKQKVKDHFFSAAIRISGFGSNISSAGKYDFIISELTTSDDQLWSVPPLTLQTYIEEWAKRNGIGTKTSQEIIMDQIIEDNKWKDYVDNWLKKNEKGLSLNIMLNSDNPKHILKIVADAASKALNEISEIKSVSAELVAEYITDYLSENDSTTKSIVNSPTVKTATELEKLFAKIKKLGKFDWSFAGGKLQLKIDGPSAVFAYKPDDKSKIELAADKDGVSLKAESKVGDAKLDAKISSDFEGKIKVAAGIKIEELFDFMGSKGSASITIKGDTKSWSVDFTLSSSNGEEAHLSHNAANKLQETIQEAANAVEELYKILETEEITVDNFSDLKEKAKKQWEKLSSAMSSLDAVAKTPVAKSEIYVSFGLKGDINGDVSGNIGLTLKF